MCVCGYVAEITKYHSTLIMVGFKLKNIQKYLWLNLSMYFPHFFYRNITEDHPKFAIISFVTVVSIRLCEGEIRLRIFYTYLFPEVPRI